MTSTADTPSSGPSRGRIIAARALVVLGVLLVIVSVLSNWVKREALDQDTFKLDIAGADRASGDPGPARTDDGRAALRERRRLGSSSSRSCRRTSSRWPRRSRDRARADSTAPPTSCCSARASRPLFVTAASLSQSQVVNVLEGNTSRLQPTAARSCSTSARSWCSSATASASSGTVSKQLPPDAGRIVSPRLRRARHGAERDADPGEHRRTGSGSPRCSSGPPRSGSSRAAGARRCGRSRSAGSSRACALLVIRNVAGRTSSTTSPQSDSVRPAVKRVLDDPVRRSRRRRPGSSSSSGIVATLGAWITGEGRRAVSVRRRLGPSIANAGVAWAVFAAVLLLLIWALPLHRFLIAAIFVVLACSRLRARTEPGRARVRGRGPRARRPGALRSRGARGRPPAPEGSVEELERLAKLRSEELLTEDEYAAAKGRLLPRAGP